MFLNFGRRPRAILFGGILFNLAAFVLLSSHLAKAASYEVLHSFCGKTSGAFTCADGGDPPPQAALYIDASDNVYGVTESGGVPQSQSSLSNCSYPETGCGTIFRIEPPLAVGSHWRESVLYSFCAQLSCQDGTFPAGMTWAYDPIARVGSFYGVTNSGGSASWQAGTIFKFTPVDLHNTAYTFYTIFSSDDLSLGLSIPPAADSVANVYVATTGAGNGNYGTDIAIPGPLGFQAQTIYSSFCSINMPPRGCVDGAFPNGPLLPGGNGVLFGTSSAVNGAVYQLTQQPLTGTWTYSQIFAVCGPGTGSCSNQPNLMGTPINGGLIADAAGNIYGTTWRGGAGAGHVGCYAGWCGGVVFKLSFDANAKRWKRTTLHAFCMWSQNCPAGSNPTSGLVIDAAGNLYGTTQGGGFQKPGCSAFIEGIAKGCGVIFRLSPPADDSGAWTYTVLHYFCRESPNTCADGANPTAPMTLGPDNALYGFAGGGAHGHGLVFRLQL